MTISNIPAITIGSLAHGMLHAATAATLLGVSSRGIYVKVGLRQVVFISFEPVRGPLTLNIDQPIVITANNDKPRVEVGNGRIFFPQLNNAIVVENAVEWAAEPHPQPLLAALARDQRLSAVARVVIGRKRNFGLAPILAQLIHSELDGQAGVPALVQPSAVAGLYQVLRSPDVAAIVAHLQPFLGLGGGLTPSGDDLVTGLLLTYNRYQDALKPPFVLADLNAAIVELGYHKTTLLSANLIECASLGQADERLILALDGILAGTLDVPVCADLLMGWGSSSGCDALVGMVLAAFQTG